MKKRHALIPTLCLLAAALAVSRGRGEGLLLNPHYQEGRLLALAPAPAEVSA